MSDDDSSKPMTEPPQTVDPGRYDGPSRSAPYPLSRTAPSFDLVDIAAQIQRADQTLATMTGGKLGVIAEQIARLQAQARRLLEKSQRDAELHRVTCNFEKKPGSEIHLYRRTNGERWFSRLAPDEWVTKQEQTFEGTFRLELDMSFTRIDIPEEPPVSVAIATLLGKPNE
ncbi:MAG TPA: DUF2452 domain-containing protein [Labilithrix sp.]|nr:DUF2452 domain-containing protein [Labilithrix sp.]